MVAEILTKKPRHPHYDISEYFIEQHKFVDEEHGDEYIVYPHKIGDLMLPTGKIVACDPLVDEQGFAFRTTVPSGNYRIILSIAKVDEGKHRISHAKIQFSTNDTKEWINGFSKLYTDEQIINDLEEGYQLGHAIDAGMSCFMDESIANDFLNHRTAYEQDGKNYYDDILMQKIRDNCADHPLYYSGTDWLMLPWETGNIALFASGTGDGYYNTFWGLDSAGNITALVTRFIFFN